jgi:hypothetical protein
MPANPDPTPQEIAQRCAAIQQTWSAKERLSRLRVDLRPSYRRCDGERETMSAETYQAHHEASGEAGPLPAAFGS